MIFLPSAKFLFRPRAIVVTLLLRWYRADINLIDSQNPAEIAFNIAVQI